MLQDTVSPLLHDPCQAQGNDMPLFRETALDVRSCTRVRTSIRSPVIASRFQSYCGMIGAPRELSQSRQKVRRNLDALKLRYRSSVDHPENVQTQLLKISRTSVFRVLRIVPWHLSSTFSLIALRVEVGASITLYYPCLLPELGISCQTAGSKELLKSRFVTDWVSPSSGKV